MKLNLLRLFIKSTSTSFICRWVERPSNTSLPPGRRAELRCRVVGRPLPTITWARWVGGKWATLDTSTSSPTFPPNGSLILASTSPGDEGRYRCSATSPLAPALTSTATLDIQLAPSFPKDGGEVYLHFQPIPH